MQSQINKRTKSNSKNHPPNERFQNQQIKERPCNNKVIKTRKQFQFRRKALRMKEIEQGKYENKI
jgi:hypothetical protein